MQFDLTPDPKILMALTHTKMTPLDALCELIDNSIDAFQIARVQAVDLKDRLISISLPTKSEISAGRGTLKIQDTGPGMTPETAQNSIKAGFSNNNPYDTLGLFGMGFNISTGKMGNKTTLLTARADSEKFIEATIDLRKIVESKNYIIEVTEHNKGLGTPFPEPNSQGTVITVGEWWPDGTANHNFVLNLVKHGLPQIRRDIGRRYATILRDGENKIEIQINDKSCEAFEHCYWSEQRYVTRKKLGNVPAYMPLDQVVGKKVRCSSCTAVIGDNDSCCPNCGSTEFRTIEERVYGWIGIQRFDDTMRFGIDIIRNGRAIKIYEKDSFFVYTPEVGDPIRDYPLDRTLGRIIGEVHMDFVPVDFTKQDFIKSSEEWNRAITYVRGDMSLQPKKWKEGQENTSPLSILYSAYRRVENYGRADMYMGRWDKTSGKACRIEREVEADYYKKFEEKVAGYFGDEKWWELVVSADEPPSEEFVICPECTAQVAKGIETCACGFIILGKDCINESCKMRIPQSETICPHCNTSQVVLTKKKWRCEICNTENKPSEITCRCCGNPQGTPNPLSIDFLLANSNKVDDLSTDKISIKLANGENSRPYRVNVYSVKTPMASLKSKRNEPIVVDQVAGEIKIFMDFTHEYFTRCNLTREQAVASEIARIIYSENCLGDNFKEHNLSAITWSVIQGMWGDSAIISRDVVKKEAEELLEDITNSVKIMLGTECRKYYCKLEDNEIKSMVQAMSREGLDLTKEINLDTGRYLDFVPYSFLLRLFKNEPERFLSGAVWNESLDKGNEEILGHQIAEEFMAPKITQYSNCLEDVVFFHDNPCSDPLTLRRVKLSIEFLRKGLSE